MNPVLIAVLLSLPGLLWLVFRFIWTRLDSLTVEPRRLPETTDKNRSPRVKNDGEGDEWNVLHPDGTITIEPLEDDS